MKRVLLLLLVLLMPTLAYASDSITILGMDDNEVLNSMDIVVRSCSKEGENVQHSLVCNDNFKTKDLRTVSVNDTCHVSYADLNTFECVDLTIQGIYDVRGKKTKIAKNLQLEQAYIEPKRILETQEWDGGWGTASDTAYAIWILSQFKARYASQIDNGLRWLKQNRDDATKCWAIDEFSEQCSVYETSKSLAFLALAEINDSFRIKSDGITWLENRQNYIGDLDAWELHMIPQGHGNCNVTFAGGTVLNDEGLNRSVTYEFEINPDYGNLLNVSCEMDVSIIIYDDIDRNIFARTIDQNDEFDFDYELTEEESTETDRGSMRWRFNPPCWSATSKWHYCNLDTTLYSLVPTDIEDTQYDLAEEWFVEQLEYDNIIGQYVPTTNKYFDSGLFLYTYGTETQTVIDWLVYSQNNDGSWGTDDDPEERIMPTAMAILGLSQQEFSSEDEAIEDAKQWMSANTPITGWRNTKPDALSFMILKDNAQHFLKINPESEIYVYDEDVELELINPTYRYIDNISYSVSSDIEGLFDLEYTNNISAYSNVTLKVKPKSDKAGSYVGLVTFYNVTNHTLLVTPLIIETGVAISVELGESEVHTFGGQGKIPLKVNAANSESTCTIDWGDNPFSITSSLTVKERGTIDLNIDAPLDEAYYDVTGYMECETLDGPYEKTLAFALYTHADIPISFRPEELSIKKVGRNPKVWIINNLNTTIDVSLDLSDSSDLLMVEESSLVLTPFEERKITVMNAIPDEINVTETFTMRANALTKESELPIVVEIIYDPNKIKRLINYATWIAIGLLIAGGIFALYWYRKQIIKFYKERVETFAHDSYDAIAPKLPAAVRKHLPKTTQEKQEENKEEGQEEEENNELAYYRDLVRIMRNLNKDDPEIREKLEAEGVDPSQIDSIMGTINEADDLEKRLKHEDQVKDLLKVVGDEHSEVFQRLKDAGYSPAEIQEAIEELEGDIEGKRKDLRKEIRDLL